MFIVTIVLKFSIVLSILTSINCAVCESRRVFNSGEKFLDFVAENFGEITEILLTVTER